MVFVNVTDEDATRFEHVTQAIPIVHNISITFGGTSLKEKEIRNRTGKMNRGGSHRKASRIVSMSNDWQPIIYDTGLKDESEGVIVNLFYVVTADIRMFDELLAYNVLREDIKSTVRYRLMHLKSWQKCTTKPQRRIAHHLLTRISCTHSIRLSGKQAVTIQTIMPCFPVGSKFYMKLTVFLFAEVMSSYAVPMSFFRSSTMRCRW